MPQGLPPGPDPAHAERIARLTAICHHRWSLEVLIDLGRGDGTSVASLAHRVLTSRTLLRTTLDALTRQGLVARRPPRHRAAAGDYALTRAGELIARPAEHLVFRLHREGIRAVAVRKWSLPALLALHTCADRFNRLKDCLPGITARALSSTLKDLGRVHLIERWVVNAFPPRTCYRLTSNAQRLMPLLERF